MQKTLLVLILAIVAVMAIDLDGDGFHSDNPVARFVDCCDTVLDGCEDPFMVNPGAYDFYGDEVVNNCDRDEYQNSNYCDRINSNLLIGIFTGPGTLASNTEFLVGAMDICAIVDDDDDPTWGFLRQENMVVSLADGKRAGYDPYPTTSGPSSIQVTAKQGFGRIGPFRNNLGAVVALSTGWATDTRDAPSFANTLPPNPPINTGNDPASLPNVYRNVPITDDPYPAACGAIAKPDPVFDSVRLSFVVRQPTNAEAFAVKAKLLTNDMAAYPPTVAQQCSAAKNFFVVLTNNTVAPVDKNIAKDRNGQTLSNLITDAAFWNNCDDYTAFPSNCDRSDIRLEFTDKLAASQWVSIGNRASRREEFRVDMILYQRLQNNPDMVVLLDDWQIIQEARTEGTPHGYMRTSDIGLDYYRLPGHNSALVPIGPGSVTYEYKVTNWGPERAADVSLAFTPPFGTRYASIVLNSGVATCSVVQAALAPFQDNSFYKCKLGSLNNLTSFTGTLTFTLINPVPGDSFKFRLTASSSSIDVDQSNNYKLAYAFAVPR